MHTKLFLKSGVNTSGQCSRWDNWVHQVIDLTCCCRTTGKRGPTRGASILDISVTPCIEHSSTISIQTRWTSHQRTLLGCLTLPTAIVSSSWRGGVRELLGRGSLWIMWPCCMLRPSSIRCRMSYFFMWSHDFVLRLGNLRIFASSLVWTTWLRLLRQRLLPSWTRALWRISSWRWFLWFPRLYLLQYLFRLRRMEPSSHDTIGGGQDHFELLLCIPHILSCLPPTNVMSPSLQWYHSIPLQLFVKSYLINYRW